MMTKYEQSECCRFWLEKNYLNLIVRNVAVAFLFCFIIHSTHVPVSGWAIRSIQICVFHYQPPSTRTSYSGAVITLTFGFNESPIT